MAHDVFVSYSSKDKPTADAVCAVLESQGIRCWVAPRDIFPGSDWGASIIEAINGARVMVLVFSANANASLQIKREVERAVNKGIPVIPLRIEDVVPTASLEYFISTPHWLDAFAPPLERHLQYLADVVRKLVGGADASIPSVREGESQERSEADATQHQPAFPSVASIPAKRTKQLPSETKRAAPAVAPGMDFKGEKSRPLYEKIVTALKGSPVWGRKRLIMIAGGVTALLLVVTVLYIEPRRSVTSSAEKDYAEAVKLASGLNTTTINAPKAAEFFQRAAEKNLPEAEARLAYWAKDGSGGLVKDSVKAEQWAQRALAHGLTNKAKDSADAQVELALLYVYGLGVTRDDTKAAELVKKAADRGHPRGQTALGLLYENGQGVPNNPGAAADLFQKGANQGYADAQNQLAILYSSGQGVPKDLGKAAHFYKKAADQGNASAQNHLGWLYQSGQGVTKDLGKAAELYQKGADQGDSSAQDNLGWLRQYGYGVPKDLGKAAELYQKAANQGNSVAQNNLGWLYQNGQGVPKDISKAAELYQKAANQGNITAENNLGWLYQNGQGVPKDLGKAAELYQKAANSGHTDAETNLGFLYYNGQGVSKDLDKAAELFQRAADHGNAVAQNQLGLLYYNGQGVAKDLNKAAGLCKKAADQGNIAAQSKLGWLYQNGQGVAKDLAKAAELYQKAADKGNADAQVNLGLLYENGDGVTKDVGKATELYRKAAAQHNQAAIANLKRLSGH